LPVRPLLVHLSVALSVTAVSSVIYLTLVAFAGQFHAASLGLELRVSDILTGVFCYLLFAFDMAALQQRWFATLSHVSQRMLVQLGSALGTLVGKVAMLPSGSFWCRPHYS
jgi:phosphate starvation-inducible membrane PsiE